MSVPECSRDLVLSQVRHRFRTPLSCIGIERNSLSHHKGHKPASYEYACVWAHLLLNLDTL